MSETTNIGILGLGAIGSVLASLLVQRPDLELFIYNRSPKSAIKIIKGNEKIRIPTPVNATNGKGTPLDWLLICLKEYHFARAEDQFKKLIAPTTKIAVIRNGLRLKEPLLKHAAPASILEGMIDCPVQPESDGFYRMFYQPILTFKKSTLADDFSTLVAPADIRVNQVADFLTASWKKLLESAALGGILALSGETCWIFKDKALIDLQEALLEEGIAVAKADGAKLPVEFMEEMRLKRSQYPANKGSSMLTDRLAGRPIEIGAKNGIIVQLGKQYQIKTPLHDLVCSLLKYTNTKQG